MSSLFEWLSMGRLLKYVAIMAVLLSSVLPGYAGINPTCNNPPTSGVTGPAFAANQGQCLNGTFEIDPLLGSATTVVGQPKCDGSTDDTATIQAQFNAIAATCTTSGYDGNIQRGGTVTLPVRPGGVCKTTGTLTINASCVGFNGNGMEIWNSNATSPAFAITTTQNSYGSAVVRDLKLEGHGAIGVSIAGNHITFPNLQVSGFTTDVQMGNNAYSDHFVAPFLFDATTAFSCPGSLTDAGEQISIDGGSIYNSTNGISNFGCHIALSHTSIDSISNLPVDNEYASFIGNDVHFEMTATLPGAFIKNKGCQTYSHSDVYQSEFYSDNSSGVSVVENDSDTGCGNGNAWTKIHDSFFSGFASAPTVTGTLTGQVGLCSNTSSAPGGGSINNLSNVGSCP